MEDLALIKASKDTFSSIFDPKWNEIKNRINKRKKKKLSKQPSSDDENEKKQQKQHDKKKEDTEKNCRFS